MISPETGAWMIVCLICFSVSTIALLFLYENTIRHVFIVRLTSELLTLDERIELEQDANNQDVIEVRKRINETMRILSFVNFAVLKAHDGMEKLESEKPKLLSISENPILSNFDFARVELLMCAVWANAPIRMFLINVISKMYKTDSVSFLKLVFRIGVLKAAVH